MNRLLSTATTRTSGKAKRGITRLVIAATAAIAVAACSSPAAPTDKNGKELTQIIVGIVPLQSWTVPQIVAREEGFFEDNGLNVALQPIVGAPIAPMAANAVQISTSTLSPLLAAASQDQDLTVVSTLVPRFPFRLLAPKGSELLGKGEDYKAVMESMRGKTIGVTVLGGGLDLLTRYLLEQYGLKPDKDVKIVPTGAPGTPQISALKTGQVDAVVVGDVVYEEIAKQQIGAELLLDFSSDKLPPDLQQPALVTAAMQKYATENPEVIEAFNKSMEQTYAFMLKPENFNRVDEIARQYLSAVEPKVVTSAMHHVIDNGLVTDFTCDDLTKAATVAVATGIAPKGESFPCGKYAMFAQ